MAVAPELMLALSIPEHICVFGMFTIFLSGVIHE